MFNVVKRKDHFERVIKEGKKIVNSHFVIYYMPSLFFDDDQTRFGISVGKKLGNAVMRNYQKRRLRHLISANDINIHRKYVIIIMRPACLNGEFSTLKKQLTKGLSEINEK